MPCGRGGECVPCLAGRGKGAAFGHSGVNYVIWCVILLLRWGRPRAPRLGARCRSPRRGRDRPAHIKPHPPVPSLRWRGRLRRKKKHHVREQQIPSWRRERATYTASPAARAIDMSCPRPGHVAASTGQPFVPRGVRGIHALVRLRVLRRRGRAGHVVCHRRGAENGGAYGLDDIAAHQQLLCADHDGVPSHRRRSRQPNEMQSRRRR